MSDIQPYPISEANWFFSSVRRLDPDTLRKFEKYLPETEKAIQPVFRIFEDGLKKLAALASEAKHSERQQALQLLSKRFLTPQMGNHALVVVIQNVRSILSANLKDSESYKLVARSVFKGATMPVVDQWYLNWQRDSKTLMFAFLVELAEQNKKFVWPVVTEILIELLKSRPVDIPFTEIDTSFLIPICFQPQKDELAAYYFTAKGDFERTLECGNYAAPAICGYINFFLSKGWEIKPEVITALVDSGEVGVEYFLSLWVKRSVYSNRMKMEPVISGTVFQRYLLEKPEKFLPSFMNFAVHYPEKTAGIILSGIMSVHPAYGQQFLTESKLNHEFKVHALWYANWAPQDEPQKSQFEAETQQWQQQMQDEQLMLANEAIKNGDYPSAGKVGAWGVLALYHELVALIALKRADLSWSHLSFNEISLKKLEKTREQILTCAKVILENKWQISAEQKPSIKEIQTEIERILAEKKARIEDMPISSSDQNDNNAGPFEDHPGVNLDYFDRKNKETELRFQNEFYTSVKRLFD